VPALAGAIKRLLDNPEEAAALGRCARQRCDARYSFRVARATLFRSSTGWWRDAPCESIGSAP